jgi:hypothetical protein
VSAVELQHPTASQVYVNPHRSQYADQNNYVSEMLFHKNAAPSYERGGLTNSIKTIN